MVSKTIFRFFPKDNRLVLFTSWFQKRYADNPMYLFEYIRNNDIDFRVMWITKDRSVFNHLQKSNVPVVYANSLAGIFYQLRAKVLISTVQFSDYSPYFMSNCILLDLGHGHPIKDPGHSITSESSRLFMRLLQKYVRFCMVTNSSYAKSISIRDFQIKESNVFISGFSRNDVFFDASLRNNKNQLVDKLKQGKKAIVYMPTHRSSGKKSMNMSKILDFQSIQELCLAHDCVFIIKKHYYHKDEIEELKQYPNIFDITNEEDIDSQVLLWQADILISDYSACYIDYLLLERPLVFYHYDIQKYEREERSIFIPFSQIDICPKAVNSEELILCLKQVLTQPDDYIEKRRSFAKKYYFDKYELREARKDNLQILRDVVNNRI